MQFNRDASGTLAPLPKPSIDTGMGLERVSAIRQGVQSNYDTDLFVPLIATIGEVTGAVYGGTDAEDDVAVRVLADHARSAAFLIADGILPSNEGRGYVLRRILRRAIRFGTKLGMNEPFFHRITDRVVDLMADPYRELAEHRDSIVRVVRAEEERFGKTLTAGMAMLQGEIATIREKGHHVIPGATVFTLYDTFGFPPDLTRDLAAESHLLVDEAGFAREMEKQRAQARASRDVAAAEAVSPAYTAAAAAGATEFTGYCSLDEGTTVVTLIRGGAAVATAGEGEEVELVLAATPFYAESGGQVGDRGVIAGASGEFTVTQTASPVHGLTVHKGRVARGVIGAGDAVRASVDVARRRETAANHTATHLLQAALRQVLGDHVRQSGSQVTPDRLRFDYTHFAPPTAEELAAVEEMVNNAVRENSPVETEETDYARAVELGATALFGEKYREVVRVVRVPGVSMELCGGTHAGRTGDIGFFKIVSEGGISSGVRRSEAVTGRGAVAEVHRIDGLLKEIGAKLKAPAEDVPRRIEKLADSLKAANREIDELRRRGASGGAATEGGVTTVGDVEVIVRRVPGAGVKELRPAADGLRGPGNRVVFLGGESEGKAAIVVAVDAPLVSRLSAAALIGPLAILVGGRGGGRPDFAQAGGPGGDKLDEALGMAAGLVKDALGGPAA
jgi:alanyl-tRNA synthetase